MKDVKLLDCTLRDGGYINDWHFGYATMLSVYKRLDDSGADYIEIGFLDDRREFDINRSIQPNTNCYNEIYKTIKKKHAIPVAMIDFGTCDISNISDSKDSFIEGIRVIFKKEKIDLALPFCKAIKEKGYRLFIQAISITSYSDIEMLEYIQKINQINPYAFSIVDTYGLLDNRKMAHYFDLLDNNLNPEIKIGYHDHNNFQLAFSNTMKFLTRATKRTLIGDATVYGMGKSAGNCPIELLAMFMNETFSSSYDINQYLEIFETNLSQIYQSHYWGYKYNYYISALQNVHPNYVEYLLGKRTLTITDVNAILSKIPKEFKLNFNKDLIEKAYVVFQSKHINDNNDLVRITDLFGSRKVLALGPGSTIIAEQETIKRFIKNNNPLVVSVNFDGGNFDPQFSFLSNAKRYIALSYSTKKNNLIIATSNIRAFERKPDFVLNYSSLYRGDLKKGDNALILLLNALIRIGVKKVWLAGFDGYKNKDNYYDLSFNFGEEKTNKAENNRMVSESLKVLNNDIKILFVTKSEYEI